MARSNATHRQTAATPATDPAALANAQLSVLSHTASAMVRATGDAQQQIAERALRLQKEAAQQLHLAITPGEIVAVQTALFVAGWQHSLQCSQDLARVWMALGSGKPLH